jgi:hypothetical protein
MDKSFFYQRHSLSGLFVCVLEMQSEQRIQQLLRRHCPNKSQSSWRRRGGVICIRAVLVKVQVLSLSRELRLAGGALNYGYRHNMNSNWSRFFPYSSGLLFDRDFFLVDTPRL